MFYSEIFNSRFIYRFPFDIFDFRWLFLYCVAHFRLFDVDITSILDESDALFECFSTHFLLVLKYINDIINLKVTEYSVCVCGHD